MDAGHLRFARFFENDAVKTRFRPHHFPFTEPSAEMDIGCDRSGGSVKIGQGSDWLEVVGCGMVHPNVLRNCGLDPDVWQGFAFGFGIDRLGMLKYGMPDLRDMFASDTRWLEPLRVQPLRRPQFRLRPELMEPAMTDLPTLDLKAAVIENSTFRASDDLFWANCSTGTTMVLTSARPSTTVRSRDRRF